MPQIAQTAQRYVMGGARWLDGPTDAFSSVLFAVVNVVVYPLEHMVTLLATATATLT